MENEAKKPTQGEAKSADAQPKIELPKGDKYPIMLEEVQAMAHQLDSYHNTLMAVVSDIAVGSSMNDPKIYVESESETAAHLKRIARVALGIPMGTPLKNTYMPDIRKKFPLIEYLLPRPEASEGAVSQDPERQDRHHGSSETTSIAQ